MKFILLIAVIAVLTYIPTDGSPLPKKEKPSSVEESDDNDKSAEIEDATSDTSEEVAPKPEKKTNSKSVKSKPVKKEEKSEKDVTTAKPVIEEEEENQFYIMVPAKGNQIPNIKPFNFKRIPKMPTQPQYVFKQPKVPSIPFQYPMLVPQERQNHMLVVPDNEVEYTFPNTNNRMTDNLPMYYIPSSRASQTFINEDHLNEMNESPFIYLDKETNPWKTYLENSGFYI